MIASTVGSVSENIKNAFNESSVGQFINNDKASIFESYNDENNDGKVSFSAGAEAFASGVKDNIKGTIDKTIEFAKKHPIAAAAAGAAVVGLGALTGIGIPAMIAAGGTLGFIGTGIGVGLGGTAVCLGAKKALPAAKETFDELKNCLNSDNDNDTLEALYNMGYSTEDVIEGGVEAYFGTKTALTTLEATAATNAIELVKSNSESSKGWLAKLLRPFLSEKTAKQANNVLNASTRMDDYYAGGYLNGLMRTARNTAGTQSGIAATISGIEAGGELRDAILETDNKYGYRYW